MKVATIATLMATRPFRFEPPDSPGQGDDGGDPDRGRLLDWQRHGVVGQRKGGGRLDRLRRHRGRGKDAQVDALTGLDNPGLARLGLADSLGVDPRPLPHTRLGQPPGAVVVQLPVVLQSADHPGQGQEALGVGALVDHDPTRT